MLPLPMRLPVANCREAIAARHPPDLLVDDLRGYHSITVNGNWRVVFRFVGPDVELVDYLDYH